MLYKNSAIFLLGIAACIGMQSCKKGGCTVLTPLSLYQSFNQANASAAWSVGGVSYLPGGVAGLMVFNRGQVSQMDFVAYDRCSTVNPEKKNQVIQDPDNPFLAIDPQSGAQWLLQDGSPVKGAECPLRKYLVSKNGDVYYIQN